MRMKSFLGAAKMLGVPLIVQLRHVSPNSPARGVLVKECESYAQAKSLLHELTAHHTKESSNGHYFISIEARLDHAEGARQNVTHKDTQSGDLFEQAGGAAEVHAGMAQASAG